MSSIAISVIVFACVFGGAVAGMFLRAVLPQDRLRDSQDAVKLGMGWSLRCLPLFSVCWSRLQEVSSKRRTRK
jgi:hypothetical protein